MRRLNLKKKKKSFPVKDKSPRLDGFTAEFYQTFKYLRKGRRRRKGGGGRGRKRGEGGRVRGKGREGKGRRKERGGKGRRKERGGKGREGKGRRKERGGKGREGKGREGKGRREGQREGGRMRKGRKWKRKRKEGRKEGRQVGREGGRERRRRSILKLLQTQCNSNIQTRQKHKENEISQANIPDGHKLKSAVEKKNTCKKNTNINKNKIIHHGPSCFSLECIHYSNTH